MCSCLGIADGLFLLLKRAGIDMLQRHLLDDHKGEEERDVLIFVFVSLENWN